MNHTGTSFKGTHIRVTALNWLPWLSLNCSGEFQRDGMSGPMANMIKVLSDEAGFTYDVTCPEEGGTGMLLDGKDWTGLVGDLYRNRADVALGPMAVTYDRMQVVSFPAQVITEYLSILAGFPDLVEISTFGTLMAFQWQVWLGLVVSLIACALTGVLVDCALNSAKRSNRRMRQIMEENWWLYVSAMFMESSTRTPSRTASRLVLAVWWLMVVVLMNAFTGHMKATMMLTPAPKRIDSFKDLSLRTDIKPFLWKGGAYEDLLKTSLDVEEYRGVWRKVVAHDGLRDEEHLYDDKNLRQVLLGKAVIVSDYTTMLYHAAQTCRLGLADGSYYFAKEPTFPTILSMAVRKQLDPAIQRLISKRVTSMAESGIIKAWIETQLGDWRTCFTRNYEETFRALSLFDMQSIFFLFFITTGLSVAVFVAEFITGGRTKPTASRRLKRSVKSKVSHHPGTQSKKSQIRRLQLVTSSNSRGQAKRMIEKINDWATGTTVATWTPASQKS